MVNECFSKEKTLVVLIDFRLGWVESWLVKLKTFIMESALKNEKHILQTFIYTVYKAKKSGNFLCAKISGNFQAPHKQWFGFCVSSFSFTLRWHLWWHFCHTFTCCQKWKHLIQSILQIISHTLCNSIGPKRSLVGKSLSGCPQNFKRPKRGAHKWGKKKRKWKKYILISI